MKKIILYSICSFVIALTLSIVGFKYVDSKNNMNQMVEKGIDDYDYAYDILNKPTVQVNTTKDVVIRPYNSTDVKIVKGYYDYKGKTEEQQKSLIYYDNTYIQNMGICYGSDKDFDVVAILDGEVTEVTNDELTGNSITIKHSDNSYSIYQSIKDIKVKKGDTVNQGQTVALSGTSNIDKDLNNHIYFELIVDGISVNPEEYYDSTL